MKNLIEQFNDNNFLVTTSAWFVGPDGLYYNAVWGQVKIHSDQETLGIKTNAHSTNWYAVIGQQGKTVIVAGCQIKYACVCMTPPNTKTVHQLETRNSDFAAKTYEGAVQVRIYLAQ